MPPIISGLITVIGLVSFILFVSWATETVSYHFDKLFANKKEPPEC